MVSENKKNMMSHLYIQMGIAAVVFIIAAICSDHTQFGICLATLYFLFSINYIIMVKKNVVDIASNNIQSKRTFVAMIGVLLILCTLTCAFLIWDCTPWSVDTRKWVILGVALIIALPLWWYTIHFLQQPDLDAEDNKQ